MTHQNPVIAALEEAIENSIHGTPYHKRLVDTLAFIQNGKGWRALRQVIADGYEEFWMLLGNNKYLCAKVGEHLYGRCGAITIHFPWVDCGNCHAIGISMPLPPRAKKEG
jgi:hypothetical protein